MNCSISFGCLGHSNLSNISAATFLASLDIGMDKGLSLNIASSILTNFSRKSPTLYIFGVYLFWMLLANHLMTLPRLRFLKKVVPAGGHGNDIGIAMLSVVVQLPAGLIEYAEVSVHLQTDR